MSTVTVRCLLITHKNVAIGSALNVVLDGKQEISDLKERVKEKKPNQLQFIDADELTVWKLCQPRPSDEIEDADFLKRVKFLPKNYSITNKENSAVKLNPEQKIGDAKLWPDDVVHILVRRPSSSSDNHGSKRRYGEIEEGEEIVDSSKRGRYLQEQDANAEAAIRKGFTPSQIANADNFRSHQQRAPVFNGRPLHMTGPPIGLYHPVFNNFEWDLRGSEPIPCELRLKVQEFIRLSADIYNKENKRFDTIKDVLTDLLGGQLMVTVSEKVQSDGSITFTCKVGNTYLLIFELKNEVGTGGLDPFVQASFAYQQYWSNKSYKKVRHDCYCPTMIVAMAGPWMCVGGAVYKQSPVAEPLTDYICVGRDRNLVQVERVFHCLVTAVTRLRNYYEGVFSTNIPDQICGYPYISEYNGRQFSYIERLGFDDEKEVYKVMEGDEVRVVKFTKQYNAKAHRLLAEDRNGERFAPALHYISSETYGGRVMVVMDYEEGEMKLEGRFSEAELGCLRKAVGRLHEQGLVFGDIRRPNILTKSEQVYLVDFDWCGRDGEALYPIDLNPKATKWASGVLPGQLRVRVTLGLGLR